MTHSAVEMDNHTMFRNIVWRDQIWIDLCDVLKRMPWLLLEAHNLQVATVTAANQFERKWFKGLLAFARLSDARCKLNKTLHTKDKEGSQSSGSLAQGKLI